MGVQTQSSSSPSEALAPRLLTAPLVIFCLCWVDLKRGQCLGTEFKKKIIMILVAVESKINTTKEKRRGGGCVCVVACIPATYLS